jgi:hypothetical protein
MREYQKAYARKNNTRLKKYNLTKEQYDEMVAEQEGCCAICKVEQDGLHVDHDHATLRVRGLLCMKCNTALGLLQDSPDNLQRAIKYLGV